MNRDSRFLNAVIALVAILLTVLVVVLVIIAFHSQSASPTANHISGSSTATQVPDPQLASEVAANHNCIKYVSIMSPSGTKLVTDAGICWIGNVKYGVDTFPNQADRDAWTKVVSALNMNPPVWKGATWVMYVANDQTHDNQ
jgi:hypothetical protein